MPRQSSDEPSHLQHGEAMDAVVASLPQSLSDEHRLQLVDFVKAYFADFSSVELAELSAEDLAGIALSHWQLARTLIPGSPKYRVFNPSFDVQGWHSLHTVIQIVVKDQPWLVSSLQSTLAREGHVTHQLIHPVLSVSRDAEHNYQGLSDEGNNESLIHIEIDALSESEHDALNQSIDRMFATLIQVRKESSKLSERLVNMATAMENPELAEFIHWLDNDQFACLGAAQLRVSDNFSQLHDTAGILVNSDDREQWDTACLLPEELDIAQMDTRLSLEPLVVCKAGKASPVIRDEPADLVMQAIRDKSGKLVQVNCLLGIFVAGLHNEAVSNIPWIRERVERVIKASGTQVKSHDGKAITATLRGLPREMLLQTHSRDLLSMATGIVSLRERAQVRLFSSTDSLGRFSNCLVYIPREAYSRDLRLQIEKILATHTDGVSAGFNMRFSSDSPLARLHFVIQKHPPYGRHVDWPAIEARIRKASVTWSDRLETTLRERHDEITAMQLHRRYSNAFSSGYCDLYSPRMAAADIDFIETQLPEDAPVMSFFRQAMSDSNKVMFKLFVQHRQVALSDVIPVIENMGLRVESERPFVLKRHDSPTVWMHEFTVHQTGGTAIETDDTAERVQTAFDHIWHGDVENDGFNRLMLDAALTWRQVVVLRALCKYLSQINVPFSQSYMIDSLGANANITRLLVELFEQRFKPDVAAEQNQTVATLLHDIDAELDNVVSLDEDRILRGYRNLILATLRTNAYLTDASGKLREFLSFKFDCEKVPDLPLPRPKFEIFVYSSKVEGIHLRGGSVARGGLRWSDRREDYRTEVLGLMKAQMVKNAVIVPVGSKGGFYVKADLPDEREAMMAIVVDCYRTFLSGLLDVTDNLDGNTVVPPANVKRYDEDDPYLVVAADKGTATFSDYANEVAIDYGFWLGDAFASGGSVGYDHKKMGITARGAWESVKRHFRNLGVNTQADEFTVVGVGDMAGDVFGNGMLLSGKLKLVAAFNHMHIFIDPNPDSASSFEERQRLFNLPRSSWTDYNETLISKGGGIFSRQAKQIELSPEAQQALGTDESKLTPTALISVILKADVDLLWNGGIGTYVKASSETHAQAADRANDSLRVNGQDLRARVVGEGGNLGFTQLGRIEFARRGNSGKGGLIYTDAIDNSAGVDCSDHEVNIKILVNAVVANDDMTIKQRDQLLESMTNDVALHVLRDNYLQTQCIDLIAVDGAAALSEQSRFMQYLESIGRLDRAIEYLPDADEIAELIVNDQSLSRPEIAVLVSYSKMVMFDELMASDFTNDPALKNVVTGYFPKALQDAHTDKILEHRLRSEIIATVVTNDLVNRLGPAFVFRMQQELNATSTDVAAAFVAVREIFRLDQLWSSIEALDNQIDAAEQYRMQILLRGLVERSTHWLIRNGKARSDINALIEHFRPGLDELIAAMPECLSNAEKTTLDQRVQHFSNAGASEETAIMVARVVPLSSSLDIVEIANSLQQPVAGAAAVYFCLGQSLELSWLRERIGSLVSTSHWHKLATSELRTDLHYQQRHLCAEIARDTDPHLSAEQRVDAWAMRNPVATTKYRELVAEMKASTSVDFAMLSLAINEVHKLLRSDRPLAG